jgi:hypothetical protein
MVMKNSKIIPALTLTLAMALGVPAAPALADDVDLAEDVDLTLGPTVIQDPDSPTGYTVHFVYRNTTATSVRFVADILLRDWENTANTTV